MSGLGWQGLLASVLPVGPGLWLMGWVVLVWFVSCSWLHEGCNYLWLSPWQCLDTGLGLQPNLHPPHNVVGDCFLPSKCLGCMQGKYR